MSGCGMSVWLSSYFTCSDLRVYISAFGEGANSSEGFGFDEGLRRAKYIMYVACGRGSRWSTWSGKQRARKKRVGW